MISHEEAISKKKGKISDLKTINSKKLEELD
jgi:hypothetical protein